ncbi:E3 ubiquitin-protein ligase TRIM21-like isoform X2 [Mauremys mutica]|uniref:E3 ubiquitin-protein ligase TRIM21-like isoform X2 n=1 Tax=Mauremys mutica TaxID=74926 RepID=UPI001D13D674|nr:E3 ubiquitin-protein ligase TRIM21-like isoform X2 [Mauremys mutica]
MSAAPCGAHTAAGMSSYPTQCMELQLPGLDVTLDPSTANPYLILAEDRKRVTRRDERQDLPDNPERFDTMAIVLGAEGFTGGRHYWEVEVGGKNLWTLGVCREDGRRKGHILFLPKNGYWTIWQHAGQCEANASPPDLAVRERQAQTGGDFPGL